MKYKVFIIFYFFISVTVYPLDISLEYYLPSLFGIASGKAATVSRFKNYEYDSRYLIPIEGKISISNNDMFSTSFNSIVSIYIEDESFSSINYSAGASFHWHYFQTSPMSGFFISFYPVYGLPIIYSRGKKSLFDWRIAADLGYSHVLFNKLQLNIYSRYFFIWLDSAFGVLPDVGISLGYRFDKEGK